MGVARLLGVCAALLFASSVSAANIIDLGPSDYRKYGSNATHTGGGVRSSFGQSVRLPPTLNTLNVTCNAVIPYGSIANGLKQFTRINPYSLAASAAVTGLFLAVDWFWDDELGSWSKFDNVLVDDPSAYRWQRPHTGGQYYPSAQLACEGGLSSTLVELVSISMQPNGSANCTYKTANGRTSTYGAARSGGNCPAGTTYIQTATNAGCFMQQPVPVDGADFDYLEGEFTRLDANDVAAGASAAQQRQGVALPGYQDMTITGPSSFTGPDTTSTSTDPVTGDTTVTTTSTQTNIQYGDTTITTTNTTTTTTYQNGQETSTTVTTETPSELPVSTGTASGDWPGFCEWATVVCDWLNWTQQDPPPEQDLPTPIDEDFFEYKEVSFGVKSCPSDFEINLSPFLETTVGVSFQPLCDFAALIYYMVMAASYIIAAYISIGVARSA